MIKWDKPCYKCLSHFCDLSCKEPKHLQAPQPKEPEQEPVAEGWCNGCNPDNCQGCGPAAKPKHEPIFWYRPVGEDGGYEGPIHNGAIDKVRKLSGVWKPLYTTPPQRTWVGLTDEEILAVNMSTVTKLIDEPIVCDTDHNIIQLGKAIEAKLKEKNT